MAKQLTLGEGIEARMVAGRVERRADGDGPARLVGHAALFDVETTIGEAPWGFRERIAPGAFARAVDGQDVRALFNHDPSMVLGRTAAGTLELAEDDTGLAVEIAPPDTGVGRDVTALIDRGDVTGMSFSFRVRGEQWDLGDPDSGELPLRTLTDVDLEDVGPVTFPAYEDTSIATRAKATAVRREAEEVAAARAAAVQADEDRLRVLRLAQALQEQG